MADPFEYANTQRPAADLFFTRNDANDVRLGEVVGHAAENYNSAQVVLLGSPQDEGVRRNGGRPGAALAPAEIRRWLYRLTNNSLETLHLFDLGDVVIQPTLEETHARQQQIVAQVLRDGKRLIVLGGGNDISYPDCAGLAQTTSDMVAINVDAHFDVRADQPRNSGTPYRQLLDEGLLKPECFFEVGWQPFYNSPVYEQYLRGIGAHLTSRQELRAGNLAVMFQRILALNPAGHIFWGFDLDALRMADAPGVSAPNPTGLSGDELCDIATIAGADPRTRLVEFSEVNPRFDLDGRTARLTALAIWHYLSALARNS